MEVLWVVGHFFKSQHFSVDLTKNSTPVTLYCIFLEFSDQILLVVVVIVVVVVK